MTLGGEVSVGIPYLGPLAERVLVSSVSASLRLLPLLVRFAPLLGPHRGHCLLS